MATMPERPPNIFRAKADELVAAERLLTPESSDRPASIVHEHPDAELWLDREAGA